MLAANDTVERRMDKKGRKLKRRQIQVVKHNALKKMW